MEQNKRRHIGRLRRLLDDPLMRIEASSLTKIGNLGAGFHAHALSMNMWYSDSTSLQSGEGGFAYVELCSLNQGGVKKNVAVKRFHESILADDTCLKLLCQEIEVMVKNRHKYMVQMIGIGAEDPSSIESIRQSLFIVQDSCNGGNLKRLIMEQSIEWGAQGLTATDSLSWSIQLASALSFLHSQSPPIIHRDIKLENILLATPLKSRRKGQTVEIRLIDFGLACPLAIADRAATEGGFDDERSSFMASRVGRKGSVFDFFKHGIGSSTARNTVDDDTELAGLRSPSRVMNRIVFENVMMDDEYGGAEAKDPKPDGAGPSSLALHEDSSMSAMPGMGIKSRVLIILQTLPESLPATRHNSYAFGLESSKEGQKDLRTGSFLNIPGLIVGSPSSPSPTSSRNGSPALPRAKSSSKSFSVLKAVGFSSDIKDDKGKEVPLGGSGEGNVSASGGDGKSKLPSSPPTALEISTEFEPFSPVAAGLGNVNGIDKKDGPGHMPGHMNISSVPNSPMLPIASTAVNQQSFMSEERPSILKRTRIKISSTGDVKTNTPPTYQNQPSSMHQSIIAAGPSSMFGERWSKTRRQQHLPSVQANPSLSFGPSFVTSSPKSIPIVKVTHEMKSQVNSREAVGDGHSHLTMGPTEVLLELTGQTGSLLYMSPEVYNEEPYNEKADVFSFAMVLYELLHRRTLMDHIIEMNPRASATDEDMQEAIAVYAQMVANGHRCERWSDDDRYSSD